jgi:alkanesulfonate monooxygenase SsuD/methylene tetrahydromethanopterin reductase-like flavin-dependent oxidoreductase (luciferase family)
VPAGLGNVHAVRIGLALPQYDSSMRGESPLRWETLRACARRAEEVGLDSLWLSDHLFFDVGKYGGSYDAVGAYEPIVTLAALAREVPRVRLGTLVLCEALRPATVLAKALATLDRVSDGRLDVGLGAGWYEPEYLAIGMTLPSPGERLARLAEAIEVVTTMLAAGGEPVTVSGRFHHADGARNLPPPLQQPRPPVFVGGKGDRLLRLVAERADGWNTCWVWTPDEYRERLAVLEQACDRVGRDPSTVWRSLGLYALCGEDEADLERRFDRLREQSPPGVLDRATLAEWRVGRLVGTVEQVREQAAAWADLGVETLILGVGAAPFHLGALDDVELLAAALGATTAAAAGG